MKYKYTILISVLITLMILTTLFRHFVKYSEKFAQDLSDEYCFDIAEARLVGYATYSRQLLLSVFTSNDVEFNENNIYDLNDVDLNILVEKIVSDYNKTNDFDGFMAPLYLKYGKTTINRVLDNDGIVRLYLSEKLYSDKVCGIENASNFYFSKRINILSLAELSILSIVTENSELYSPYNANVDANGELLWKVRSKEVLNEMYEKEYITKDEYDEAIIELEDMVIEPSSEE